MRGHGQGGVKIELEEQRDDASLGADKHESMIRDGGMPVMTSATMTASAAAGAAAPLCASSPRRSKRKLEEMATAASATVRTASEAMATISTFQYAKQPKLEGCKTSRGVANPEPSAVARHRKTGRVAVKQEATAAVVKKDPTGAVVKKEAAVVKQETTRAVVKQKATATAEGAGFSRDSQNNASTGNLVKRERRRVGGARGPGSSSSPTTMKREKTVVKKSPRKAERKVKVKAEEEGRGGENVGRKKIPPRLAEKAALIISVMDALYPDPPIPINHVDSFTLLCGVLLSAQTTDGQVNEVTKELFRVAPDPLSLSKMDQEDVQRIIRSVGLAPTKAKHLIALSQQLLDRFDGQVPDTFEGLQSLPGVGRKTAAVVMVQAFGVPAFPVDTHIHRLALRWGFTKSDKNASKVEEDLKAVFPRDSWAKLHLQFIYFGREHCQARIHDPKTCPVCSWVKKTGSGAPKVLSDLNCLRDYLASPTPPKKSSKNAIVYSERLLEMEQFRMKIEES